MNLQTQRALMVENWRDDVACGDGGDGDDDDDDDELNVLVLLVSLQ